MFALAVSAPSFDIGGLSLKTAIEPTWQLVQGRMRLGVYVLGFGIDVFYAYKCQCENCQIAAFKKLESQSEKGN